jgi:predicted GH43/DUF377 family glycosyl hydrolase
MHWTKRGRIYVPDGTLAWARHYAFPPTPVWRPDGTLRLYVCFCDEHTVGRVGWVDVDPDDPGRVLGVSREPVLDIGRPGAFDENGLLPTCVVDVDGELWMYYVGYQLGDKLPYFQFEGLAISRDGGESFQRRQRVPVTDRSDTEMVNRTSAFVRRDAQGGFEMWYVGGSDWTEVDGKPLPVYNMRHMRSPDGVHWPDRGDVCLDFSSEDEHAFGRPWVSVRPDGTQWMFYSLRTRAKGYRLGLATSPDGLAWTRRDAEVGIDVGPEAWDSQEIAYASLVDHGDTTYLFYNGNERGKTGFGYATLDKSNS